VAGWGDNRLSVYFGEKASFTSRTPTRLLATATVTSPTPPPPPPSRGKKTNLGAIIGGAVGGGVALLLAIGLIWLCVRRHRENKSRQKTTTTPTPTGPNSHPTSSHAQYVIGEKHSAIGSPLSSSRVGSPSDFTQQHTDSVNHSSQYGTPPPTQQEYPYFYPGPGQPPIQYHPGPIQPQPLHGYPHPAHGSPPMQYYPPPPPHAPQHDVDRIQSHEMPTVRSPEIPEVHQPKPLRPDVKNE
jgi:hypothetical protein